MMKILICYMFCTMGGVETAIKNRIKNIDYEQYSIDLLFFHDYGGRRIFQNLKSNVFIESNRNRIIDIINSEKYDLVISIDTKEILDILLFMKYQGKVGLEVHTTYLQGLGYLKKLKDDFLSFVIVPSVYQKMLICNEIDIKVPVFVLPNSIDTELFYPSENQFSSDKKILLWVGRLDEHKNWRLFLEIARELNLIEKKYRFWVIGGLKSEEYELKQFHRIIYKYGLYNTLKWIPFVSYENMREIYSFVGRSKGGYIVTSVNESFGMTVLESMLCKCPAIVNDVGALGELVTQDETGMIMRFESFDRRKIAHQIDMFLENPDKLDLIKERSFQYTYNTFNSRVIGEEFVKIITNV